MARWKSPNGIAGRTVAYELFRGLDTSRDDTSKDTGQRQYLEEAVNCFCDWRGQIVRDASTLQRFGERPARHIRFFAPGEVAYAEVGAAALNLVSERGHRLDGAYPRSAEVSSLVFGRRTHIFSRGQTAYTYDGTVFEPNPSKALQDLRPAFGVAVARRMAVAGIPGRETEVHLSRVDRDDVFPDDEPTDSVNVLRAGFIDVANLLGAAEQVTGLASFEQNRLIIFTTDRALIFIMDPDLTRWGLDQGANIHIGCVSHNTIASAGRDVVFASRSGIHSIQRSQDNGVLAFSTSLSDPVDLLYRKMIREVPPGRLLSATWDQDRAQYHLFFPTGGADGGRRLTLAMNPEAERPMEAITLGTHLNASCGDCLGGELVFGAPSGLHTVMPDEVEAPGCAAPRIEIVTPMLWHGSLTDLKTTHSIIVQAHGRGVLEIDAVDDEGRELGYLRMEIDADSAPDQRFGLPLASQYERKWAHRYRGARYRFRVNCGGGLLRIVGFALVVTE